MPFDDTTPNLGGRPPFVPTKEQRDVVERAAGLGLPQEQIRQLILNPEDNRPISAPTLEKYFREELDRGPALLDKKVGDLMVHTILGRGWDGDVVPLVEEKSRTLLMRMYAGRRMKGFKEERDINLKHSGTGPGGAIVFVARGADEKV